MNVQWLDLRPTPADSVEFLRLIVKSFFFNCKIPENFLFSFECVKRIYLFPANFNVAQIANISQLIKICGIESTEKINNTRVFLVTPVFTALLDVDKLLYSH